MSFSFLGALASLLPGYINGQRMANQDNWNDLNQYNQVQQGQQANMYTAATWNDRLNMYHNAATNSGLSLMNNGMQTLANYYHFPGLLNTQMVNDYYAPYMADLNNQMQMLASNTMMQNPLMFWGNNRPQQQMPSQIGG